MDDFILVENGYDEGGKKKKKKKEKGEKRKVEE